MLINQTVTKKVLESIVHETFLTFGSLSSSSLLDALKFLGFYYATNAGISINIEDLKTPDIKSTFLLNANNETQFVSTQWKNGIISENERFQAIIDSWNIATESLKNRIVDYYQQFDPVNNLYIMAFSGARGNMSQVRQLVGMRGLMSDQDGKIIDLPIQTNFREGLSSIDYIISSYGARKGIVDTALKTADSGYLTRRLIYVAQDLVIREFDCKTKTGLIILLKNKISGQNFIGRSVLSIKKITFPFEELLEKEVILDSQMFHSIQKIAPVSMNLRSSLTCKSNGSVCQVCYGWDLAHNKLIGLGEVVGILAAQSIGEPGTQLTMRTFHTGGIFTSETLKQVVAPFSGKLILPDSLKYISIRTNHGIQVLKLQQEINLQLVNWKGEEEIISLQIGSFLYFQKSNFVQKGQLIAEYSTQAILPGPRKSKPIYSTFSGQVKFENIILKRKEAYETTRITHEEGVVWVTAGTIFRFPKKLQYKYSKTLQNSKAYAQWKIITPIEGTLLFENNILIVTNLKEKKRLNLNDLVFNLPNCSIKIVPLSKNYQYVDSHTIIAYVYFYPIVEGKIVDIRITKGRLRKAQPQTQHKLEITNNYKLILRGVLFVRDCDTWEINSDQVNNFPLVREKKVFVRSNSNLNLTSRFRHSGIFLKKNGFKLIFQHALPIFLTTNSALYYHHGQLIEKNRLLATLVKYTQQTEDIVQGLPKIEELIEARKPRNACQLAKEAGIILDTWETVHIKPVEDCLKIVVKNIEPLEEKKTEIKRSYYIGHKLNFNKHNIIVKDLLYLTKYLPENLRFESIADTNNKTMSDETHKFETYLKIKNISRFKKIDKWKNSKVSLKENEIITFETYKNGTKANWEDYKIKNLSHTEYKIKEREKDKKKKSLNSLLLENEKGSFLLSPASVIEEYKLPLKTQFRYELGVFIDLGEPISEGMIDVHQLLKVLFEYHLKLDGLIQGTLRSLTKFQLLLVNSIQAIYQSQGVNISSKHIEIIVRQMTAKVIITESGDTPLLPGELISTSLVIELCRSLEIEEKTSGSLYHLPYYEPKLRSATNSSLTKDGFLSAAGFQETRRVLTKAAVTGSNDWLRGLKESLITGRIIPAGSAFLNYKNYLNNIYSLKN